MDDELNELIMSIVALVIVAAAVAIFSVFFLPAIFEALLNGVILYFVSLKAYADITKRKLLKKYVFSAVVSAIFIAIVGNMFPVWVFTTWALLTVFVVVLTNIVQTKRSVKH
ncbi:hypothetical protein DRJ25_01685 [Candidatus Woesearchaeota archaeon]|nr:MAG: hypothetical protein DRJ25_01685 [Candidatus Woesearchaeota archaeon]